MSTLSDTHAQVPRHLLYLWVCATQWRIACKADGRAILWPEFSSFAAFCWHHYNLLNVRLFTRAKLLTKPHHQRNGSSQWLPHISSHPWSTCVESKQNLVWVDPPKISLSWGPLAAIKHVLFVRWHCIIHLGILLGWFRVFDILYLDWYGSRGGSIPVLAPAVREGMKITAITSTFSISKGRDVQSKLLFCPALLGKITEGA